MVLRELKFKPKTAKSMFEFASEVSHVTRLSPYHLKLHFSLLNHAMHSTAFIGDLVNTKEQSANLRQVNGYPIQGQTGCNKI